MSEFHAARSQAMPDLSAGACTVGDPESFFPPGSSYIYLREIEAAKAVCRSCVVLDDCREWAIASEEAEHGIWGGLSEDERRALRRRGNRQAAGF